jgi:hypothetical protein
MKVFRAEGGYRTRSTTRVSVPPMWDWLEQVLQPAR